MNRRAAGIAVVLLPALIGACAAPQPRAPSAPPSAEAPSSIATQGPPPTPTPLAPEPSTPVAVGSAPTAGPAAAALALLPVKGRAPRTGYDREEFGPRWADVDRNGCDTRNDILRRDLTGIRLKPGTRGCVVAAGTLRDPYSGATIAFVRGAGTSSKVQIDHVVSLSNAWQTGAAGWADEQRRRFANDPVNLLAVDGGLNAAKSDGDAATWLPPDRRAWCPMVARQIAVKRAYGLWVTAPERDAMQRVLGRCPGQALPTG
jgi:hypothetical protein